MTDNEAAKQKTLRWLKTAFLVQAIILIACLFLISYAFVVVLPKLRRQQVKDQQTIQSQQDKLQSDKRELVGRYLESAALFYNSSHGHPDSANINNALAALNAALAVDPDSTDAMNYEAEILASRSQGDDLKQALSVLNKSIRVKPTGQAYETTAIIYCRTGQDESAIDSLKQEFQISPERKSTISDFSDFNTYCSQQVKDWVSKLGSS